MTRIVIADDHAIVREGLKRIVGEAGDLQVVDEAADGMGDVAHDGLEEKPP